jgi:hypothetical protein
VINANLENLIINEDELFNRVLAVGPGDGINRAAVVVEDAVSISKYGIRETQIDVVDVANFAELAGRAESFLELHKEPVTEIDITFFYDTSTGPGGQIYEGTVLTHDGEEIEYYRFENNREVKRGDTIRIVIRSLGINTTGVIEELDWEPGSVSMSIGAKRYNLLDVVDGARLAAERGEASLGVPAPISFRATAGNPGCVVRVNPYNNSRAVGIEVYGSTSSTFATGAGKPSRDTLLYRGSSSRVELPQLVPGTQYYFVARAFDTAGKLSAFTPVVSVVAGFVTTGLIGPGQVQQGNIGSGAVTEGKIAANAVTANTIQSGAVSASKIFVDDEIVISSPGQTGGALRVNSGTTGVEVLRLGNISGKGGLPSGTYGLWGELGTGVFIRNGIRISDIKLFDSDVSGVSITNIATGVTTGNGFFPAGSANNRFSIISTTLAPAVNFTVPSGQRLYMMKFFSGINFFANSTAQPPELDPNSGALGLGDHRIVTPIYSIDGPTSVSLSDTNFDFNITGFYHGSVSASTYKAKITGVVLIFYQFL